MIIEFFFFMINLNTSVHIRSLGWMFILQLRGTQFETNVEEKNNEFQLTYIP